MDARGCLSSFAALRALPPILVESLAAAFVERTFGDGHELIRIGDRGTGAYLLLSGELSVTVEHGGAAHELARFGRGALVGHLALFDHAPASATVRVVGSATVGVLSAQAFGLLMGARAELAYAFQRAVGEQVAADFRRLYEVRSRARLI